MSKGKSGKLKFTKEEKEQAKTEELDRKITKTEVKAGKYGDKLDDAREKLPTKTVKKKERVFNEEKGKTQTKFTFEKEVIPINEAKWNKTKKKSLPRKAGGALKTAGVNKLHSKVYEVEQENVGTQAAHRAELAGESVYRGGKKVTRSAYRFARNTPYRRASKFEVKSIKAQEKLEYQKALRDNPKLRSNPISRFWQKRSIKKQYAEAFRTAQKSGKTTKKAVGVVQKAGQFVTGLVRKNPATLAKLGILLLIIFMIIALFSMCSILFSGGTGFVGATSYLAEDADIDNAELAYTEWETDLLLEIQNAEAGGYDEYRYNIGDISHNPFELMAYLTAVYQGFTFTDIESDLRELFAEQYNLSYTEETEIRYRTETRTGIYIDDDGNEVTYTYEEEVPYEWRILNIVLTSRSFTDVVMSKMDTEQLAHYNLLMETHGNRQYLQNPLDFDWLSYVSSYYGWRIHPTTGLKDYHKGIDIAVAVGTEIHAGQDGRVTSAGNAGDYGLVVVLEDDNGLDSKYAHLSEILVRTGQEVKAGDVIAKSGNTGNSTGPHLHLEVIKDSQYLNPLYFVEGARGSSAPGTTGGIEYPEYPGEPMGDGAFAALMEEAQKHLGKPYVFGASGPDSFDCSGFVCYVLNHSGVASVGRTTAQGLYNMCTPVSGADAQPGDLIFFQGTYSTSDTVTHIGIYIGNGMMIHAGNPVQYASIESSYWQQHLYSFARLN